MGDGKMVIVGGTGGRRGCGWGGWGGWGVLEVGV